MRKREAQLPRTMIPHSCQLRNKSLLFFALRIETDYNILQILLLATNHGNDAKTTVLNTLCFDSVLLKCSVRPAWNRKNFSVAMIGVHVMALNLLAPSSMWCGSVGPLPKPTCPCEDVLADLTCQHNFIYQTLNIKQRFKDPNLEPKLIRFWDCPL